MPAGLHFGSLTGSCLAECLIEIRLTLLREDTVHGGTDTPTSINNQDTLTDTDTGQCNLNNPSNEVPSS